MQVYRFPPRRSYLYNNWMRYRAAACIIAGIILFIIASALTVGPHSLHSYCSVHTCVSLGRGCLFTLASAHPAVQYSH